MKAIKRNSRRRPADPASLAHAETMRILDAVDFSGLSRTSLYRLMNAKKLPSVMVAGRRLIPRAGLVTLLNGGGA